MSITDIYSILPLEILINIFNNLDYKSIAYVSGLDRRHRNIINSDIFRKQTEQRKQGLLRRCKDYHTDYELIFVTLYSSKLFKHSAPEDVFIPDSLKTLPADNDIRLLALYDYLCCDLEDLAYEIGMQYENDERTYEQFIDLPRALQKVIVKHTPSLYGYDE